MGGLIRLTDGFEGRPFTTVLRGGQPVWIAREVGRALDYSEDGKGLVHLIRHDWAEEFDATAIVKLTGSELRDFSAALDGEESSPSRGGRRSLLLLTEKGLWLACLLSRKPEGRRLRQWVAERVLPALRKTGVYEIAETVAPRPDARLDHALAREGRLQAAQKARGWRSAATLARKLGKGPRLVQYYEARAAAIETGEELPQLLPVLEERTWTTAQIAAELAEDYGRKVSASVLGRHVVSPRRAELQIPAHGRLAEAARKHSEGSCEIWRWTRSGVQAVKEAWIDWMISKGETLTRSGVQASFGVN